MREEVDNLGVAMEDLRQTANAKARSREVGLAGEVAQLKSRMQNLETVINRYNESVGWPVRIHQGLIVPAGTFGEGHPPEQTQAHAENPERFCTVEAERLIRRHVASDIAYILRHGTITLQTVEGDHPPHRAKGAWWMHAVAAWIERAYLDD